MAQSITLGRTVRPGRHLRQRAERAGKDGRRPADGGGCRRRRPPGAGGTAPEPAGHRGPEHQIRPHAGPSLTRSSVWPPPKPKKHPRPKRARRALPKKAAAAAPSAPPKQRPRPRPSVPSGRACWRTLQGLWSRFWEYLKTFYAPAIAAWQAAWQQIAAAAQTVWGPVKAAALALWNEALLPLAQYLATVFLPGVVNSFSPGVCAHRGRGGGHRHHRAGRYLCLALRSAHRRGQQRGAPGLTCALPP